MKIEVLGTGCPKCRKTEEMIRKIVDELGVDAEVVHVYELHEIADRGVMMTPAIIVDGEIRLEGRMPTEAQIRKWLGK